MRTGFSFFLQPAITIIINNVLIINTIKILPIVFFIPVYVYGENAANILILNEKPGRSPVLRR
jgi:hypothetical protein